MNTRIKQIRESKGLSQAEFAEMLNLKRNSISLIEVGKRNPSDRTILDICNTFNVSEKWLRTGEEPIWIQAPNSTMEKLRQEFDLDEFSYNLVHEYLKLDSNTRQTVRDFFYNVINKDTINVENEKSEVELQYDAVPKTSEELEALYLRPAVQKNGTDEK